MTPFHPDLRLGRWLPRGFGSPWLVKLVRRVPYPSPRPPRGFTLSERRVEGRRLLILEPPAGTARAAMLYIHSGGYVMGSPELDFAVYARLARALNLVVVAVDYRLAPEHPYPAALDDCYAAFEFMHREAGALGIDPQRIIVSGMSAGGGLAAALTLRVHDQRRPAPMLQHLIYPMLDDRSTASSAAQSHHRLWDRTSNLYGWRSYLGREPGGEVVDYAAPARRRDLTGLPPTWIGVGTLDLFHDEDVLYAQRLREAGVPTTLEVVEGAFHGFDVVLAHKRVSRRFADSQLTALRNALNGTA